MNDNKQNRLITFFILYSLFLLLYWQFFGSKQRGSAPPPAQKIAQDARSKEAEGQDPHRSLGDRIKSYQAAIDQNEKIKGNEGSKPAGIQARYEELRLLRAMSDLERDNTAHWDKAESILKDMEAHLAHTSAEVVLAPGQPATRLEDVGKDATARLEAVRYARDQINHKHFLYLIMDSLVAMTCRRPWFSYWFALLLLTVVLKLVLWPFTKQQFKYMRDMQRIQPLVKEMQEKMKGRPADEQQRRMMQIYKENNVNMAGGCVPMLVPMALLIPVYSAVRMYDYQFSKGYFLWIGSNLSHQLPAWFAKNLATFDVPMFALYVASMALTSLLQPKAADPQAAQQQKMMTWMMPVIFGVMMWIYRWSSAFMFYWLTQNLIALWQQWRLLQHFGPTTSLATAGGNGSNGASNEPLKPMPTMGGKNGNGTGTPNRLPPKKPKKGTRR